MQVNLIFTTAFSLFLLMDAIGNVPLYLVELRDVSPKRQKKVIVRELLIALGVIIAFSFLGEVLLNVLGVSQATLQIAGGIILFMIAIRRIFPQEEAPSAHPKEEPFIVPLAIPLVAGPSVLAAVMIYSKQDLSNTSLVIAIILAWLASALILVASSWLNRVLGRKGITACERLVGFILILIAVQMLLEGVSVGLMR